MDEFKGNLCALLNYTMVIENISECDDNFLHNETDFIDAQTSYQISSTECAAIVIYILFSFLALVGNAVVLRLLYKRGNRRTVFDITVGSLVVADLCTASGFFSSTVAFLIILKRDEISKSMETFFDVFFEFTIFCFIVSILHIILITTERLYALFFPLKYRQAATKKRARVPIVIIWMASSTGSLVHALVFKGHQSDKAIGLVIIVSSGILCIMYSIIAIRIVLLKRKSQFKSKKDRIVLINSLAVTISFLACLLPLAFGLLGANSGSDSTYLLSSFVAIKLMLDPVLYFYVSFWKGRRETERRLRLFTAVAFSTTSFMGSNTNVSRASRINSTTSNNDCDIKQKEAFTKFSKSKEFRRYKKTMSKIYK